MDINTFLKGSKQQRLLKIKLISTLVLSNIYTYIFAFIIYGSLDYPIEHLIFDYCYSFIYFFLLYEVYCYFYRWLNNQKKWLNSLFKRLGFGLIMFVLIGNFLKWAVGIIPFLLIFEHSIGAIEWSVEMRMNVAINVLFCTAYYLMLTGYQVLKDYHYATVKAEKLSREIAIAQYEGLRNQVNPHFLFNSLNVLSSLVHRDAEMSEIFISRLAKAYRYVLEQRDHELVELKTELDFINAFVFLLKIRFENKLKVQIAIPADKLNCFVAPLTLQLLIENAVKHNILSVDSPLIIDIMTDEENYLLVKNNVQLRKQQFASTGIGLKNITNRYSHLTNKKVIFNLTENNYIAHIPLLEEQCEIAKL